MYLTVRKVPEHAKCGIADPCYLQTLHFILAYLLKFIPGHTQRNEKFEPPDMHIPSWRNNPLSYYFRSLSVIKYPFEGLCSAMFFTFVCFLLVILLFMTAPKQSVKCCTWFLMQEDYVVPYGESTYVGWASFKWEL